MQRLVNTVLQKLPWNVRWEGLFCDQTVSDGNWTEFLSLQIRTFKTTEKTRIYNSSWKFETEIANETEITI
jgi:hypothetical protein